MVRVAFTESKTGLLTGRCEAEGREFWLHSPYDPVREAERTMQAQLAVAQEPFDSWIVYGFGCGHHLRALLKEPMLEGKLIEVWETNLEFFHSVSQRPEVADLLENPRIRVQATADISELARYSESWEEQRPFLLVHEPSLRLMPPHLQPFQELLVRYKMFLNGLSSFGEQMQENFQKNVSLSKPGIARFVGQFEEIPFLLISAGPSLQRNLHLVEEAKKHCLVGCVGTALKPVVQAGVEPDFFMIIDPKEQVAEQVEGLEEHRLPFFFMSTAHHRVAQQHRGPAFLVYQEGYEPAERAAQEQNEPTVKTGGSVSTALFELVLQFGANPVCLIGQDLAYTDQKSHVTGAHMEREVSDLSGTVHVENFWRTGTVPTVRNLVVYRDYLQRRSSGQGAALYNATEGGAFIEGFHHVTLESFLDEVRHVDAEVARGRLRELVHGRK
ncbi:motility associated factor glycosyltransferase family protein [Tumebacillus sp. ITR2]|uniref:Motility associated factor glycosyltransferase family protein n=1 Tax=Tumebacillus amylolyticus TaxID=2801339 RepID=A0ABS1J5G9_9BACL|nr:6-hydroxymethylpterin diphosphokinase MptE-like protein [Tumebacillus amylolyticus]MBL0385523.1 motility associated factor glycosyltransferase family protein [Tumebacillus amylolyticus]